MMKVLMNKVLVKKIIVKKNANQELIKIMIVSLILRDSNFENAFFDRIILINA